MALLAGGLDPGLLPYPRSATPPGAAGPVYVVNSGDFKNSGDTVTLQTLAGALARAMPQVYTVKSVPPSHGGPSVPPNPADGDTTVFWLQQLESRTRIPFDYTFLSDFPGLLRHFARNITGAIPAIVIPHPGTSQHCQSSLPPPDAGPAALPFFGNHSVNAGALVCRRPSQHVLQDGVVISVGNAATAFQLDSLNIPKVADLTNSTPYAEYVAGRDRLSSRAMCAQPDDGSKAQSLSDYAVFARLPTAEHAAGGSLAFDEILSNFDQGQGKINAVYGWTDWDEHIFTTVATKAGAYVHASDFVMNLAFFANMPPAKRPPAPTLDSHDNRSAPVHTLAFLVSDGDNLQVFLTRTFPHVPTQLLQNNWIGSGWWTNPARGSVPVGYTFSPAMSVLMPGVIEYVWASATANDSLSTGPSGAGYSYPALFTAPKAAANAAASGHLMAQSGQSLLNVIGVTPSEESVAPLVAQQAVSGAVYLSFSDASAGYAALHGNVAYVGGKPVVSPRINMWGNGQSGDEVGPQGLVKELLARHLPTDPTDPGSYTVVLVEQAHNYSEVVETARALQHAGGFDIVLPE
eukprot:gene923-2577_t